jgi:saccharopine dehydrogenase-like NADP-dependent oxidoreductase
MPGDNISKHILLFGAGKSATVLIDYLKELSTEKNWRVTIADSDAGAVQKKSARIQMFSQLPLTSPMAPNEAGTIGQADLVISLMPPHLHYLIALDCLEYKKNLLTASYVDEQIKELSEKIRDSNIIFLYEMGLDPGIDHMSAMKLIHSIKEKGGTIRSFKSHCGGLVAPESDDNPWHYKISWNPRKHCNGRKGWCCLHGSRKRNSSAI